MNKGMELAQTAADILLIRPALEGISILMEVSATAFRRITLGFAWLAINKLFTILLAVGAFAQA